MNIITLVLIIAAFVVFLIAAYGVTARWNLVALGLALYMLSLFATTIVRAEERPALYPPKPNYQGNPYREDEAYRRERWNKRRWCREWEVRVERHPRLVLPRECWHRRG
jgi:hypothetical protein